MQDSNPLSDALGKGAEKLGQTLNTADSILSKMMGTMYSFYQYWEKTNDLVHGINKNFGGTLKNLEQGNTLSSKFYLNFKSALPVIEHLGANLDNLSVSIKNLNDYAGGFISTTRGGLEDFAAIQTRLGEDLPENFYRYMNDITGSLERSNQYTADMLMTSQKMGLNVNKVARILNDNIQKASTFTFAKGAKGIQEMAKYASQTKISMDSVLNLAEKLMDPEGAVEFAQSLQMLGGEFQQMSDPFQLMYEARNAPEELQKRLVKATASVAQFNKATGEFDISSLEMQRLRKVADATGLSLEELKNQALQTAKATKIKGELNFNISDDQALVLSNMAKFSEGGKLKIEQIPDLTSIKSQEELQKKLDLLTETSGKNIKSSDDNIQYIKDQVLASQNLTKQLDNLSNVLKSRTPDLSVKAKTELGDMVAGFGTVLASGGKDIQSAIESAFDSGAESISDVIKTVFGGLEEYAGKYDKAVNVSGEEVFNKFTSGFDKLVDWLTNEEYKNLLNSVGVTSSSNTTPTKGSGGILADGGILNGPSHANGGIDIANNQNKVIANAEGGEAVINKESTQMYKSLLSMINEAGGGSKFSNTDFDMSKLYESNSNKINEIKSTVETSTKITSEPLNINVKIDGEIKIDGKGVVIPDDQKQKLESNIINSVMLKVNSEISKGSLFQGGKLTGPDKVYGLK